MDPITDFLKQDGIVQISSDQLKIFVNTLDSSLLQIFKNLDFRPSGPAALLTLTLLKQRRTSCSVMTNGRGVNSSIGSLTGVVILSRSNLA